MSEYQSGMAAALEKSNARSRRAKKIVLGSVVALVVIVALAVGLGVGLSRNKSSSSSSSGSSGASNPESDSSVGDDPSNFEKDDRLHQSFYGIAYTPEGSIMPDCGAKLEDVIKDIQLMSQLTKRVRLYGADCNQSALVLEAIQQTKVDMQVYLANYDVPGDSDAYTRQRDALKEAIQTYGTDHIAGVTVGNEYILNYLNDNGGTDPNDAIGNAGGKLLIADIDDTKQMLSDLGVDLPVGNSDAGSYFNNEVLENVDYGMSNVHAWFANTTADDAADWVFSFFEETNVEPASELSNSPQMYIAETGWPTKSSDAANANNGASDASEANLQIFIDDFVCQANSNNIGYFFFEFFDEEWKDAQYGGVEGWWGLFTADRQLKDLTIPDCAAP
ncbi:glycoside hydrolase family 17 protein [Schizophyllum amplum]|uniref:glucan endo-1,3-beta-D-glucosidase n=1 Tax=Schizophyllum amplum TaxID=97359 RepID=A0A550CTN1_9AGAR|nr:glycoside hydrolase family 17 protein [Auriculariopsis ampla]